MRLATTPTHHSEGTEMTCARTQAHAILVGKGLFFPNTMTCAARADTHTRLSADTPPRHSIDMRRDAGACHPCGRMPVFPEYNDMRGARRHTHSLPRAHPPTRFRARPVNLHCTAPRRAHTAGPRICNFFVPHPACRGGAKVHSCPATFKAPLARRRGVVTGYCVQIQDNCRTGER
jgi:hypothetical protein